MKRFCLYLLIGCLACKVSSAFAESPAMPLSVQITDVRVVGLPKVGNTVTVQVDFIAKVAGRRIAQPPRQQGLMFRIE